MCAGRGSGACARTEAVRRLNPDLRSSVGGVAGLIPRPQPLRLVRVAVSGEGTAAPAVPTEDITRGEPPDRIMAARAVAQAACQGGDDVVRPISVSVNASSLVRKASSSAWP